MAITKSELLRLRQCPNWFWLLKNQPEAIESQGGSALVAEGNAFEVVARHLFPGGKLIRSFGESAVAKTQQLMASDCKAIFQATFQHDGFLVRADVLERGDNETWKLYEIKASIEDKEEYLVDIGIQRAVIQDSGVQIAKCSLVLLNPHYVRAGSLDVNELVIVQDVTAQARAFEKVDVRPLMEEGKRVAALSELPESDIGKLECVPNGPLKCACASVSYAELPDYSVFDLSRVSRKDCSKLLNEGITELAKIPKGALKLTRPQAMQIVLTQKKGCRFDRNGVKAELGQLRFPIYFLDYETFNFAVPPLNGFKPFQQFVFQYSLHVLRSKEGELEHREFLADKLSIESVEDLAHELRTDIKDDEGSVVVWHRSFEEARNGELGHLVPELNEFFRDVNRRIYDLEEVFKQQLYVDYRFRGRTSIKAVLPVLCPSFSYSSLNVQHGGDAMEMWYRMVNGEFDAKALADKQADLLAYCELDTLAMVSIYQELSRRCERSDT